MSDNQREALTRWADLIYKIGVPLGLAALFFLKSNFATRGELMSLGERIGAVEKALEIMAVENRTNGRQDSRIDDHEQRLRALERRN